MKTTGKKTLGERINALLTRMIRFVTYDIGRITENEVSGLKELYINIIKTIILAVRGFQSENLQTKASALTYSTFLLSIVPPGGSVGDSQRVRLPKHRTPGIVRLFPRT